MEDLKLIMDDIMTNRESIRTLAEVSKVTMEKHNNLAAGVLRLERQNKQLTKCCKALCLIAVGLDVLIMWNAIDIHKLKKDKREENKEG